ncbi:MAG TPA: fibronectin type III domain-containing protein [Bacteroidales bacterium]|nr:fibronectin type III domain-containing protein [Bacteroidales bacterium]HOH21894.1 fibronectin type III domain-containing protein [Bacteroidales bacterium]HPZ03184.1 fibronectin type III domain-containing protein [Bacteroidales bacterium]HQB74570.1 fibronectin type III domain-containing protein [Bacteroidales bacterium]
MKKILFFLMSVLMSFQLFSQAEFQVGSGTTTWYDPLPGYYGWNRSAYLYKADEINVNGTISAIAFEISSASSGNNAKMKIYLVETSMTAMPALSATNWNALKTGATQVYENNALASSPTGWKTFTFDTPFTYSGTSNLMVLIEGEGCTTTGGCRTDCYNHDALATHWYRRTDSSAPDDNAPSTSATGQEGKRANIKFTITPPAGFCYPPSNLAVSNLMSTSADLTWTTHTSGNYWEVQYKESSDTVWSSEQITYLGQYSLTNLDPQTTYDFRVKSICANDISGWATISFTTACPEITTLPWTDSFDTYGTGTTVFPPCWTRTTTYANRPYVNSTNYSAPGSLYFYAGSGTYNIAATPMFDVSIPINTLQATFMYRTTYSTDTLFIGVMTDPTDATTFEQVAYVTNSSTAAWYPKEVFFTNYTGQGQYIAFMIRYHTSTVYGYIDDLSIDLIPSCPKPSNITVVSAETDQLEIGWQENGSAISWTFEYKKVTETDWTVENAFANPHTIYNLETATPYVIRIKSDCSGEESDYSDETTVMTACGQIATLPWSESFDLYGTGSGTFPPCWSKISTNSYPNISTSYKVSSPGALYMYAALGAYNFAITPEFASSIEINTLTAYFQLYKTAALYTIEVGVISDPQDMTTYVPIDTVSPTAASTWQLISVDFASYTGTAKYIAFRIHGEVNANGMYIDDFWVGLTPSCNIPTDLTSIGAGLTENSITIDWDGADDANVLSWNVIYKPIDALEWQTVVAHNHPYTITGLEPNQVYKIMISANCLTGETTYPSSTINVGMPCVSINTFPWSEGFEGAWFVAYGLNTGTHPWCWTNINGGTQSGGVWRKTTSSSYVRTGTGALQMYSGSTSAGLQGDWFITPVLSLTGNEQFSFWAKGYSTYTDILSVKIFDASLGAVSTESDTTNFVDLIPNTVIPATEWTLYELSLSQYVGEYQIAFVRNTTGGYYLNIDDVLIEPIGDCARPTSVSVIDVTPYSAEIDFLPASSASSAWYLYYKPQSSTDWDSVYINTYPYTLEGLTPNQTYEFYLRTDCGADLSDPTVILSFTTECLPIETFPWTEGFEDLTAASTLPDCWAATRFGTYTNTQIVDYNSYNRNARTGTAAAYFRYGSDDHFFTPGFQLQAGVAYEFSFWYVTDGLTGWNTLEAGVYSAQNASALLQTVISAPTLSNTTYQELSAFFTPEADGVYYFGLYCQASTSPWYITLDDFSFGLAPECLPVTQLQVSDIAASSAYLTWTTAGTPDYYSIEIEDLSTNTTVNETSNDPYFILTGLNELTDYSVSVQPMCSGIEGVGQTIQFRTTCFEGGDIIVGTPDATTNTNGQYLPTYTYYNYSLTEQIFDAAELTDLGDSIYGLAFQYFFNTAITRDIEIYLGHTEKTTFTGVTDFVPASSLTMVYQGPAAWVNTNEDYWVEFNFTNPFAYDSDSNLVVVVRDMSGSYTSSSSKFRTHATLGTKAIYFYQDGSPINIAAPIASYDGVVINRNNIKFMGGCNPFTCAQPNIILTDVDVTSASMIIVPGMNETSWEGEFREVSETDWTTLGTISNTNYILDNLTANTTYQLRLRTDCGGGDYSNWKTILFTTLCGDLEQLPFVENFDTYPSGSSSIPDCWTRLSTQGDYPYISAANSISTPNSVYFYSTGTNHSTLILPPVSENIDVTTLQLLFWARVATQGYQLEVGVMTDPTDINTFTLVGTAAPSLTNTHQEFEINFDTYVGTGRYIAIRTNGASTVYMDDLMLREIPNCVRPANITFSGITQNGATVSWSSTTTAMSYEIVYGLTGFDPENETPQAVNDTFVELTGLTANTVYEVYVRSVCSDGSNSEWTAMTFFRTACGVISSLPWSDSFDSYGTGTTVFPVCWTRTTTQSNRPYIHASTYYSAPGALYFYAPAGTYNIAATPEFDASLSVNTFLLSFMYRSSYTTDTLFVGVMTDPTDASTFEQVAAITNSSISTWFPKEVFFNNYTGNGKYIAFLARYGGTSATYGYIDNVVIDAIPSCPRPSGLSVTNVTQTSVDLSWLENGTSTSWEIEYGALGFTQGTGTILPVTTNPAAITGLTASTCYDIYVRAVCAPGDESDWSDKLSFCTNQIPVDVPFMIDFETPSGFTFANNPTGNNWYIGSADSVNNTTGGSHGLYISNDNGATNAYTITSATVVWAYRDVYFAPSTADYTLTFDWKCDGEKLSTTAYDYMNVYIGDPVMPVSATSSTIPVPAGAVELGIKMNKQLTWQDTSFTLSSADYSGQTKRLYFCWRNDGSGGTQPPVAVDNIEITSTGIVDCLAPTNLAVSNITSDGATATWTAGGTETSWVFEYKTVAATTWTTQNVTTATYTMTGLQPSTQYETRVKAICDAGDESDYTAIVTFTTEATPCVTPTNLQVTNITDQSAVATWTAGGTETSWQVDYKLVSATNWTTATANTTSFTMTGLQSNSNYHVRVKAICADEESAFTEPVPFTTAGTTTYTITATAGPHGTITPSGDVTVNEGGSQTFTFTPEAGYRIDVVLVDGAPQVPVPESYTFENIQANHTIHVDFAEGIAENELSQYVTLYPNPTQSLIDLKLDRDYLGTTECRIYDMYGKLMRIMPIEEEITTIDVSDFAAGVYFVRLTTEQGQVSKRFVKK